MPAIYYKKYWQIITKIQVDYPTNHCQLRTGGSNTRCTRGEFDTQILNIMDNFEMDLSFRETERVSYNGLTLYYIHLSFRVSTNLMNGVTVDYISDSEKDTIQRVLSFGVMLEYISTLD